MPTPLARGGQGAGFTYSPSLQITETGNSPKGKQGAVLEEEETEAGQSGTRCPPYLLCAFTWLRVFLSVTVLPSFWVSSVLTKMIPYLSFTLL